MAPAENIKDELDHLLDRLNALEEEVESRVTGLRDRVLKVTDRLPAGRIDGSRSRRQGRLLRKAEQVEMAVKRLARPGVDRVRLIRKSPEEGSVVIGTGSVFRLPMTLWTLLLVLSLDSGEGGDGFVGIKSWPRIQAEMEERLGKAVAKHTVQSNLSRLRTALLENLQPGGGANPYLLEVRRGQGARFRLRKDGRLEVQNEGFERK